MTTLPIIRPAKLEDALAMAHVHVDTWRTTYAGIVPNEHLANLSYERSAAGWAEHLADPQGECIYIAEDTTGQIVGLASGGPLREELGDIDGELYVLYVWKAFQGIGFGRRLANRVAQDLADRGFHTWAIWVLKDNPACGFYERLGGQVIGEKVVEIGGKSLVDVAFTWPNLYSFMGNR